MAEFGHFTLVCSWIFALLSFVVGLFAALKKFPRLTLSCRNMLIASCCSCLVSLFFLGMLFLADDYSNQYVWQHSNKDMPWIYKLTAIWGGMDGSMLLWASMLCFSSGLAVVRIKNYPQSLSAFLIPVLASSILFFTTLLVFFTNPFRYIQADFIPSEGNGLNPLLQNPYMAIHPPMLYLGFTTFAIPFAFCLAALCSNQLNNIWITLTRRWTLIAWGFLTTGIVLGGHWAYLELGWGGFWAWDPVENASFLPWLTGTAFLHSVMIQERKGMLKLWNIFLIILTYGLTVFGTFLTRSGIVQSVHAFAATDIGFVFVDYLIALTLISMSLIIWRKKNLKSERTFVSIFSRESAFLFNNLIFLSICFATLWGVMFPVFSEAFTGVKQAVGIPFFNAVNLPLFLLLIFMMGVGPLIAWRQAKLKQMLNIFFIPFVLAFVLAALMVFVGGIKFYPTLSYGLCAFVLFSMIQEIHRGYKVQKLSANSDDLKLTKHLNRHRRRYGGYLVHFGILVMTVAITASMAHKTEQEFTLANGESYKIGRFNLQLNDLREITNPNHTSLQALTTLSTIKNNQILEILKPEVRHYPRKSETTTEVALRMGLREDFYLVLAGTDESGTRAAFKVFINPLQVWLWIGTLLTLAGTVVVLLPKIKRSISAPY